MVAIPVTPKIAIEAARQRLETARLGLADMRAKSARYHSGLQNAVVFGRMVTLALQNMRGEAEGWDAWYEEIQDELRSNPLARYFVDLRNKIEKQASSSHAGIRAELNFNTDHLNKIMGQPPPRAKGFAIGSVRHGGASGWIVQAEDGTEELFVVDLPEAMVKVTMSLIDLPTEFSKIDATELVDTYLNTLQHVIDRAEARFA